MRSASTRTRAGVMARRGSAALALGVLTTVGVAWAAAALMPITHRWPPGPALFNPPVEGCAAVRWDRPWHIVTRRHAGVEDVWWDDSTQDNPGRSPEEITQVARASLRELKNERPYLAVLDEPPSWGTFGEGAPPPTNSGSDTAFGLPWPCLWYRIEATRTGLTIGGDAGEGMVLLKGGLSCRVREFAALPLKPRWAGLAADVALYSLTWFALLTAATSARARLRMLRGLCAACAYDRAGLAHDAPCPECGVRDEARRMPLRIGGSLDK